MPQKSEAPRNSRGCPNSIAKCFREAFGPKELPARLMSTTRNFHSELGPMFVALPITERSA
jgi:hypothetical protein